MFQLSREQAQKIVDQMMEDIPYNINIMNHEGIIIGSGNPSRVGTVHQGAVQALASGKMVKIWKDGRYEKQGTNEPIVINHKRVGVIGISGNPEEVSPFCRIVKTTVSLLIEQGIALKSLEDEANRKKAFLESLLSHAGAYSQRLQKEALQYKIDLLLKSTVLLVRNCKLGKEYSKLWLLAPSFMIEENTRMLVIQDKGSVGNFIERLLAGQPDILIAAGNHEANIATSYVQAKSTMNVMQALELPQQIIHYDEVEFLVKLSDARLHENGNIVSKLEDTADLLDTLRVFINQDGSISNTSERLNIHRNTLQYRLKRIKAITGKDPRNLLELFELMHSLLALYS
ncbi:CdaR family transcriptional regulator [Paenibacillus aceti]|uniref:Transcriptional regulator n=1 Tax=Paenibacillus aceti TaxID=1820010 RepID=A0ABQ1VNI5_9BACL|nr:sugar diacid recognition domain-containing protein [Paenibacillus aceti]GGF84352.1 transcriptional regulator [Paenibacillus aceti]